jgi:hypothetical protein
MTSARDVAAKLDAERKLTISARDIARYMLALDGTDHVRQALEGEPVTLPPARATETVTPSVTPTDAENAECALCAREPRRFFRLSKSGKKIFLCDNCTEPLYLSLRDAVYITWSIASLRVICGSSSSVCVILPLLQQCNG